MSCNMTTVTNAISRNKFGTQSSGFRADYSQSNQTKQTSNFGQKAPSLIGLLVIMTVTLTGCLVKSAPARADIGIATWYSVQSTKAEGNTGITASGEKLNEKALTCAVRSRKFGTRYKVTNLKTGKSVVCRHNDYGPGKGPAKRGVIIDLTPAAFDALGGKRGPGWGEFPVKVVKS